MLIGYINQFGVIAHIEKNTDTHQVKVIGFDHMGKPCFKEWEDNGLIQQWRGRHSEPVFEAAAPYMTLESLDNYRRALVARSFDIWTEYDNDALTMLEYQTVEELLRQSQAQIETIKRAAQ